ncbi:hypothetical protein QFC21_006898 [Naganishia friedmannii]|uniref:Uncharacterized protein n=1 Tax=Naganishia friedmannii TaxID=89922 RepID=A0ACC2V115_9TREE|nr:hypothetical protein QFC21_006898 [Naganishia friedmannii]
MSTYEDDHNIPEDTRPNSTNPTDPSPYAARDAPRTFEGFMQELQRIVGAVRLGESQGGQPEVDGGGLMVDEDLYDEIFGNLEALGGKLRLTASYLSPRSPHSQTHSLHQTHPADDEQNQSCPICMLSYDQIITEQEYAEASDYHIGGNVEEMGLRRLPCAGPSGGSVGGGKSGHIVCGKCASKWLRLNNTCPLCRAIMDPSVSAASPEGPEAQANYTDPMLQLFRSVFGHTSEAGPRASQSTGGQDEEGLNMFGLHAQAHGSRPNEDDEFNSMYS